jgi:hypothetical protein
LLGGLQHDGASGGQGWRNLPRDHRRRKIPRGDRIDGTNRLPRDQQSLVRGVAGDDLSVGAFRFFGVPLDEAGGVFHLTARLGDRLTHLLRHQPRDGVFVFQDRIAPLAKDVGTLEGRLRLPGREGVDGAFNRLLCIVNR